MGELWNHRHCSKMPRCCLHCHSQFAPRLRQLSCAYCCTFPHPMLWLRVRISVPWSWNRHYWKRLFPGIRSDIELRPAGTHKYIKNSHPPLLSDGDTGCSGDCLLALLRSQAAGIDSLVRTPYFKDFFGDWEKGSAPRRRPTTEDSTPFTSALNNQISSLVGGTDNIAPGTGDVKPVSVVVDENGQPLVVYHGTTTQPRFTRFRRGGYLQNSGRCDILLQL